MDYSPFDDHGLILVSRMRGSLDDAKSLARDVDRGILVKLRRGAYVARPAWAQLSARDRHLLRVRAVLAAAERPVAVSGLSAAAVWGMPISGEFPDDVTVLDEWRGGGRAEPGVRRTAAGFRTARFVEVDGIRVTDLTRTALDVARKNSFANAVGSVDWALWRENSRAIGRNELAEDVRNFAPHLGRRHLERVAAFATSLSESFGESQCRAVIHLLGFEAPELQVEFRDELGAMYPDYYWRSVRIAAEFDGKHKYTRNKFTNGDPAETVWREKKREDRLRRQLFGFTRILTSDVERPDRLAALLSGAGVPHGRRN